MAYTARLQHRGDSKVDSFGRTRVSSQSVLFDSRHLYNLSNEDWFYSLTGSGNKSYDSTENTVDLTVTAASGDKSIKQSRRYFTYTAGKSQYCIFTAVLGKGETNLTTQAGLFDANNGIFWEVKDGKLGVVIRSDTSGSIVDSRTEVEDFNIDKLSAGSLGSEINVDLDKMQLFGFDFQWLGSGAVRFFIVKEDGEINYCHIAENANTNLTNYMATSSLPVRFLIENTGATSGSNELKTSCVSIVTEALDGSKTYKSFTSGNGATLRTNITTRVPIYAIRLANSFNSKDNRVTGQLISADGYSEDSPVYIEIVHVDSPSTVTGTFSAVKANVSACEESTDISVLSGGTEHIIDSFYVSSGGHNKSGLASEGVELKDVRDSLHYITQNIDSDSSQYFAAFATRISGSQGAKVSATLVWLEIE